MEVDIENIVDNFDQIFDSGDEIVLEDLEFEQIIEEREPMLDAQNTDIVSWSFVNF